MLKYIEIFSLILIFILLFSLTSFAIQKDKVLHFSVGTLIYYYTNNYTQFNPMLAVSIAGVGKELYDSQTNGTVELADILATTFGGFVMWQFNW